MTPAGARRFARRLSMGAELQPDGGAHVRVWAPRCRTVDLVVDAGARMTPMRRDADGWFEAFDRDARAGTRYQFRLDGDRLRADPASRFQPEGPEGPSAIVDPAAFRWTDADWAGVPDRQVLYELHIGTFTPEGTWNAAAARLDDLASLGITTIELMPVGDFAGQFGWGYDSVNLYAPTRLYGTPDELRAFVDAAHARRLAVILDVVYNHLGPEGNYLEEFAADYFTDRYENDWGKAINFEGPSPARAFFVENAAYWIAEFHLDGLRLDATQDIRDSSPDHVIASMVRAAREAAAGRRVFIVAENEPQDTRLVRPPQEGGDGCDALWNDDAHHAARVALTGRREAYYRDYLGTPQEFLSCAKYGYLYQGQWYSWQKKTRGTPALDLSPAAFVAYLENHDQVANSAFGLRLHEIASQARLRAITAWLLLGPATPMLFQGQEFAASAPFLYFADHGGDLKRSIRRGRREFLAQFPSLSTPQLQAVLPSPTARATFERCRLDWGERERHASWYALHRDLLALRHADAVLAGPARQRVDGAVLGTSAFVLRWFGRVGDRLLVINLGSDLDFTPAGEPLLAPGGAGPWQLAWTSEAVEYGGHGVHPLDMAGPLTFPGNCALFFEPASRSSNLDPRSSILEPRP